MKEKGDNVVPKLMIFNLKVVGLSPKEVMGVNVRYL